MKAFTRSIAAAMLGCLGLLSIVPAAVAQPAAVDARLSGSIDGVVRDDAGAPLSGAMISAIGATTAFAVSDEAGRFRLGMLPPGSYLLRAHLTGFNAARGEVVEVRAYRATAFSFALTRAAAPRPVLEAGILQIPLPGAEQAASEPPPAAPIAAAEEGADDHGQTAWRLRHARRGVLKEATIPAAVLADSGSEPGGDTWQEILIGAPVRLAANLFNDVAFSGQFNLLTTGQFDTPDQLFTPDSFARSVADISVGAPAGEHADWSVRGALTQGDVSSWIVAGAYSTRAPGRHVYDVGLSYSTQRYNAGNPAAFGEVYGRNAGVVFAFDTFAVSRAISVTYGARYARYDYLAGRNLLSPQVAIAFTPIEHLRVNARLSRRATAPGAEEFVPPADDSLWQPTQRTFSPLVGGALGAERTTHAQVEVERDFGNSTVLVRRFSQQVDDQTITVFGAVPGHPVASLGHYFVAANGTVDASGWAAGVRTALADRVHASVEYTQTRARWSPTTDLSYLIIVAPGGMSQERLIHNVSTSVETEVPETSTKVLVLYRMGNGFAHTRDDRAAAQRTLDARFDVQVRQSLPFMDFSSARWEMLVAVKNFFREAAADQSVYDELLVVGPPKRIVGGLTLHF